MAILSGLFNNSDSENNSSSDLLGILDAGAAVDFSNINYNESVDDDGSSETSYNETNFGADLDVGSLLSSMSDNFSSSDSDSLFG